MEINEDGLAALDDIFELRRGDVPIIRRVDRLFVRHEENACNEDSDQGYRADDESLLLLLLQLSSSSG